MSNEKKYLVFEGYVFSKNDGQRHFINSNKLIYLYHVKRSECIIARRPFEQYRDLGLIQLRPRYDGNYKLEETTHDE